MNRGLWNFVNIKLYEYFGPRSRCWSYFSCGPIFLCGQHFLCGAWATQFWGPSQTSDVGGPFCASEPTQPIWPSLKFAKNISRVPSFFYLRLLLFKYMISRPIYAIWLIPAHFSIYVYFWRILICGIAMGTSSAEYYTISICSDLFLFCTFNSGRRRSR